MIGLKKLYITFLLTLVGSFAFSQEKIRITCRTSVGVDSLERPLYVIVARNKTLVLKGEKISGSFIETIDANYIDKVEVLKDAASTALYGSRAQYGVVIITMKKDFPRKAYKELQKYAAL